jgi:multiple RNA-binding domain-containing protein 1
MRLLILSLLLSPWTGSLLDSHALEVKPSDKRLTTAPAAAARSLLSGAPSSSSGGAGSNNKLIVRNVAFQATKTEIRDLFAAFGSVKRVRIPRKMGGEHRGFAFVDFR